MRILTDTHTLVWALAQPQALGSSARAALDRWPFTASVVNLWELVLKAQKPGSLVADPVRWWDRYVGTAGIPVLTITTPHIRALPSLPEIHRDPFDRLLVAQARTEGLTIATKDHLLGCYGVPVVWD